MKMSIRTRLFLGISCLIVFFVVLSLLLNSQFLGKYYVWQKKENLIESQRRIGEIYKGDPEAMALKLESLERNEGLNITFLSPDFITKYSSFTRWNTEHQRRFDDRSPLLYSLLPELDRLSQGEYFTNLIIDSRLKTKFLVLASRLNNDDILILSTPLVAINESAKIANRFFLFIGFITILLGGVAVYFFTRRFTKPILELNEIAKSMAKLDFSKKYPIHSEDEIGQLGQSINSLSNQLDKSISELVEANQKLTEDIERERKIDKMRKEFISNVSHELKTPLALIQGYAEGLTLNVNDDEENRNFYCDVIMDETNKMNRLVKDLLELSQIESGYFKLEQNQFDLSALVYRVADKYRPVFTEKVVNVAIESPDNVMVKGDMGRIEQVLINYLNNAINHVDEHKLIKITVTAETTKVKVAVYNSGQPIPEEALEKIWVSFYKVDKARTRAYGGTGLGLSVVRAIMELHQNDFGVANQDKGVVFWFELDRSDC